MATASAAVAVFGLAFGGISAVIAATAEPRYGSVDVDYEYLDYGAPTVAISFDNHVEIFSVFAYVPVAKADGGGRER
jgi:hypothetical protein